MQQGVAPSAALAFLLAAPAVNPIVLVSTAVAFPGEPRMVVARFLGSLLTSCVMGWLWLRLGKFAWFAERALSRIGQRPDEHGNSSSGESSARRRWFVFAETARHDLVEAAGFLVLGAAMSAVFNVAVPSAWMQSLAGQTVLGVLVMALLAVVLALCSEADAFVAAALPGLPLLPRLVFLVVGPAVDVKLVALQAGTFGRAFAARFAPVTFVVAVVCSVLVGSIVLAGA